MRRNIHNFIAGAIMVAVCFGAIVAPAQDTTRWIYKAELNEIALYPGKDVITVSGAITFEDDVTVEGSVIFVDMSVNDLTVTGTATVAESLTVGVDLVVTNDFTMGSGAASTGTIDTSSWDISGAGAGSGFISFSATTIGGITEANLVDKTATESISGAWTHSGDFAATGAADFTLGAGNACTGVVDTYTWNVSAAGAGSGFTSFSSTTIGGITEANLVDKTATESITGAWTFTNAVTVGANGAGVDVRLYSGTTGDSVLYDASLNQLIVTGINGSNALNIADGDFRVEDDAQIGGSLVVSNTINGGADAAGVDWYFNSLVSGDLMLYDASLRLFTITGFDGSNALNVADGDVVIADDLAVTGTITAGNLTTTTTGVTGNFRITSNLVVGIDATVTNDFTLGSGAASTGTIDTSSWDISGAGAGSGFTEIAIDGKYAAVGEDASTGMMILTGTCTNGQATVTFGAKFASGATPVVTPVWVDVTPSAITNGVIDTVAAVSNQFTFSTRVLPADATNISYIAVGARP